MKELLIVPGVALLLISFAMQLESIAQDSGEKAVAYAEDMSAAMDCATHGILISECSPDLLSTNFDDELNRTQAVLTNITTTLS
ncbi:hypothetical protein H6504_00855 [Candidatus Woesearchaeota archaeon]|nr:hypothetical protein [Candidatus Woesearchaeota archaeon]